MTDEQILKKAIEKAVKNGYELDHWDPWKVTTLMDNSVIVETGDSYGARDFSLFDIIYDYKFAEAFWGKEIDFHSNRPQWQLALRQLVIEIDKLKFIERFL